VQDTGVVHQHVDPAFGVEHVPDRPLDGCVVGHVELQHLDMQALGAGGLDQRFPTVCPSHRGVHPIAPPGEPERDERTQPAAASSDQNDGHGSSFRRTLPSSCDHRAERPINREPSCGVST
jgi:hypothetical protein